MMFPSCTRLSRVAACLWLLVSAPFGPTVLASPVSAAVGAIRVEPANWWVDFQDRRLMLMMHAPGLASARVSAQDARVTRLWQERRDSPNYLFVHLELAHGSQPGPLTLTLERPGATAQQVKIPLERRAAHAPSGFSQADAVMLISPDRFVNGDITNDTVPGLGDRVDRKDPNARHGGDIAGMIRALDYIQSMGFTQIWPTPVLENKAPTFSYHGYAITDFYRVDPRHGSLADYKRLSAEARRRGIGLIKDVVLNHAGIGHWWVRDLPSHDWFNRQGQPFAETSHKKEAVLDPYRSEADLSALVDRWFVESMPDLNQRNPLMAQYLIQNSLWWVETLGLSGIRVDTYSYSDRDFLTQWSARMAQEYPKLSIVGEEWHGNPVIVSQWQRGKQNPDGYKSHISSLMDFPLYDVLPEAFTTKDTQHGPGLNQLYGHLVNDILYPDPSHLMIFGSNHDGDRLFKKLNHDPALVRMALTYLATLRGIPQFYYGVEAHLANQTPGHHGEIRADLPGGFPGDVVNVFTGKGMNAEQRKTQETLRKLLTWRQRSAAVKEGRLMHYVPDHAAGTYVYFRYLQGHPTVMVVINKGSDQDLSLDRFHERISPGQMARDIMTGASFKLGSTLRLRGREALVLEISAPTQP
ncbi:MAG: alpha-amylase family glycosyl hydrolase [Burkholderiaceae bacterium]